VPPATTSRTTLRLGVAGPVGTGKSSIIALICREMAAELQLGVITNEALMDAVAVQNAALASAEH